MKINALFLILLLFGSLVNGYGSEKAEDPFQFVFDRFLQRLFPAGQFVPSLVENYFPETTSVIEESNGFGLIDNARTYYEGDSVTQFNWYLNDVNINSGLNDGSAAVIMPLGAVDRFTLSGDLPHRFINGLNQLTDGREIRGWYADVSAVAADLGSYSEWSQFLINTPASERDLLLREERRKILSNTLFNVGYHLHTSSASFKINGSYYDLQRQFNDFSRQSGIFEENGRLFLMNVSYLKRMEKGFYELFAVFNTLDRSNADSELGVFPQQTADLKRFSLLAGFRFKRENFHLSISLIHENEDRNPFVRNGSKELIENDGVHFYPDSRFGEFRSTTLSASGGINLIKGNSRQWNLRLFADMTYSKLDGFETVTDYHPMTVLGEPYMVREWTANDSYSHYNSRLTSGLALNFPIGDAVKLKSKLFFQYSGLSFQQSQNNLSFLTPGYDIGLHLFPESKTSIMIAFGDIPYKIGTQTSLFLERKRPDSAFYYWNDGNGDGQYQASERGDLYGYSGGSYHFKSEDISAPRKQRLLIYSNSKLSDTFTLQIKGILKFVKNSFWVNFDREYGNYKQIDGNSLYIFDSPFQNYYLNNYDFEDSPFSGQFHFNFIGKRPKKWFFSFSFMAHIGMGYTAFGNGINNDIGMIDESMANPNSWLNGFGRVDGDRGFVSKLNSGFFIAKGLSLGINIKYRDGNPFTFMKLSKDQQQWVIYYKTIKGEDKRGKKGGPREDYLADLNVKLNYRTVLGRIGIGLSLEMFNVLDVGYELSEWVFTDEDDRLAAELQIPRSIRFTLSLQF